MSIVTAGFESVYRWTVSGGLTVFFVLVFVYTAHPQPIAGDLDFSGSVNAVDIQLLVNRALGIEIDVDEDGLTDAAEINLGFDRFDADSDDDGMNDMQHALGCTAGDVGLSNTVVINEIFAHSHMDAPDWIELHNTTDGPIDIGGWFLSDDEKDLKKYEIAEPTVIEPGGYVVLFENEHFGNEFDPGAHSPFALSANGETVHISSGWNGALTAYHEEEDFGPSLTGIAFGRHEKSTRTFNFVAMSENTPGTGNASPQVGPMVITEIMYNPQGSEEDGEYIEMLNISNEPVNMHVSDSDSWRFTKGIDYVLPVGVIIPPGGYLLVAKDPALVDSMYAIPDGVPIVGPYDSRLANEGETLQISMPGNEDQVLDGMYIRVDRVVYDNESPWPTGPDGNGSSLTRITTTEYGNDPANWMSASPTPGR